MEKRLVVGFDGSAPSRAALLWALDRAAEVVVAHVVDADAGMAGSDFATETRSRAAVVLAEARALAATRHPGARIETALLEGPVAWALAGFAGADDLLVIGTHKTGFLHGRVLGSRSVEVAILAACDVLVIGPTDLRFRRGVVAAVADDPAFEAVSRAAARAARDRDDELLILHAAAAEEGPSELLDRARDAARSVAPDVVIRTRSSRRGAAELLLDAGRDRALMVIGDGDADRARSPIGSVLHDVLLNLTAPTLVVHAAATASPSLSSRSRRDR